MAHTEKKPGVIKIALVGNPNSGKTTIFNNFTGFRRPVGNYPGVTVKKEEGEFIVDSVRVKVVDLPGTYSLTAYSPEELVVRKYIIEEKPDVVVDVLNANNLERSLYLATQLMELDVPLVLALNMNDEAKTRGIEIDLSKLSKLIGTPIVPTVSHKREGMRALLSQAMELACKSREQERITVNYGRDIEDELESLMQLIQREGNSTDRYNSRWLAVKLLENDQDIIATIRDEKILSAAEESSRHLENLLGDRPEIIMAERRYGFISGACQEAVSTTVETRHKMSDKIDDVVMSGALGIPILLSAMYAIFYLTFNLGEGPQRVIEYLFGRLALFVSSLWPTGAVSPLKSLLVEGIIGGVGGVVVFLPNILLLFFCIALLEDTGYTARAAFVMDRLMHKIGLHGKSFIPLLVGFGCSVPAIIATRTLENRRDRLVTMLIIPLISCGGRHPIYIMIIAAFFTKNLQVPVLWTIYLIGILLAMITALLLGKTIFKELSNPFVMELPPYRIPTAKSLFFHMWQPAWLFLRKAGTVIFGASIILWVLVTFPHKKEFETDYTTARLEATTAFKGSLDTLGARLGLSPTGIEMLSVYLAERRDDPASLSSADETHFGQETALISELLRVVDELEKQGQVKVAGGSGNTTGRTGADAKAEDLFSAASYYLEEVKSPLEARLAQIERLKHNEQLSYSIAGRIGRALESVFKPLGFDWKISTSLIGALAAKELFIAQMGIIYAVEESEQGKHSLREKVRSDYSPLVAVCILLFLLISTPCMATLAVIRKESGSWGWAFLQWGGLTVMAYLVTLVVFQLGSFLGIGTG